MPEQPSSAQELQEWFDSTETRYDRFCLLDPDYAEMIPQGDGTLVLKIRRLESLMQEFREKTIDVIFGTCREIAAWGKVSLEKKDGLKDTSVWCCADDDTGEAHFAVLAIGEDGQDWLVDRGYNQPPLQPIPLGQRIEANDYANPSRSNVQSYGGKVAYEAHREDDTIIFTITPARRNKPVKRFTFRPATEERDAETALRFLKTTGSLYRVDCQKIKVGNAIRHRLKKVAFIHSRAALMAQAHRAAKAGILKIEFKD